MTVFCSPINVGTDLVIVIIKYTDQVARWTQISNRGNWCLKCSTGVGSNLAGVGSDLGLFSKKKKDITLVRDDRGLMKTSPGKMWFLVYIYRGNLGSAFFFTAVDIFPLFPQRTRIRTHHAVFQRTTWSGCLEEKDCSNIGKCSMKHANTHSTVSER